MTVQRVFSESSLVRLAFSSGFSDGFGGTVTRSMWVDVDDEIDIDDPPARMYGLEVAWSEG